MSILYNFWKNNLDFLCDKANLLIYLKIHEIEAIIKSGGKIHSSRKSS
jgi:hypothetical protein